MSENNDKITTNEEQFASLKLPTLINFYEFTGIPKFEDSQERKKLLEDIKKWEKKEDIKRDVTSGRVGAFIVIFCIGLIFYNLKPPSVLYNRLV